MIYINIYDDYKLRLDGKHLLTLIFQMVAGKFQSNNLSSLYNKHIQLISFSCILSEIGKAELHEKLAICHLFEVGPYLVINIMYGLI
jgi:hypothetical protein